MIVSEFVSDKCSILLTVAVSIDEIWLLPVEDPTDEVSPPPPIPSIRPSPSLSSIVRPRVSIVTAGGWSEVGPGRPSTVDQR